MRIDMGNSIGDFYPRSPCGERRWLRCWQLAAQDISIHALLAESDVWPGLLARPFFIISIHALLAESDRTGFNCIAYRHRFLSTLSLRRATASLGIKPPTQNDFYPRSPCGERQSYKADLEEALEISIHALLAESDLKSRKISAIFFSISIHALLAESDLLAVVTAQQAPRFLSTLSLRRATCVIDIIDNVIDNFYPRSPCGERLRVTSNTRSQPNFYPRSPCGERLCKLPSGNKSR